MQKVLVICGPTGIGKSALSIDLALKYHGEIISGDSMQIYKKMNIGTAKPDPEDLAKVPHHLIDIKELEETFSVADFQTLVRYKIAEIASRHHLPIIVGGTGLYLKAALYDYVFPQEIHDSEIYANEANHELHEKLRLLDPQAASEIHPNNRKRIIRALNIATTTDYNKSATLLKQAHVPLYDVLCVGLTSDRDFVYGRINRRVDKMFEQGLLQEASEILACPSISLTAKQAIGYKEFIPYFEGRATLDEVKEKIKQASRRYAKRQFTWFNNQMDVSWFDIRGDYHSAICEELEVFLHE